MCSSWNLGFIKTAIKAHSPRSREGRAKSVFLHYLLFLHTFSSNVDPLQASSCFCSLLSQLILPRDNSLSPFSPLSLLARWSVLVNCWSPFVISSSLQHNGQYPLHCNFLFRLRIRSDGQSFYWSLMPSRYNCCPLKRQKQSTEKTWKNIQAS